MTLINVLLSCASHLASSAVYSLVNAFVSITIFSKARLNSLVRAASTSRNTMNATTAPITAIPPIVMVRLIEVLRLFLFLLLPIFFFFFLCPMQEYMIPKKKINTYILHTSLSPLGRYLFLSYLQKRSSILPDFGVWYHFHKVY